MLGDDGKKPPPSVTDIFGKKENTERLKPFTTPEALNRARAIIFKEQKLMDQAKSHLDKALNATRGQPKPQLRLTGRLVAGILAAVRRSNAPTVSAQVIYKRRIDRIEATAKAALASILMEKSKTDFKRAVSRSADGPKQGKSHGKDKSSVGNGEKTPKGGKISKNFNDKAAAKQHSGSSAKASGAVDTERQPPKEKQGDQDVNDSFNHAAKPFQEPAPQSSEWTVAELKAYAQAEAREAARTVERGGEGRER